MNSLRETCADEGHIEIRGTNHDHCARCGWGLGPEEKQIVRPTGQDSPFLAEAIACAQADSEGYCDQIEDRLTAGEAEYGRLQFLLADGKKEALEETLDIGGWLALDDFKWSLQLEAGKVDPVVLARARHLLVTAGAHAVRSYACIRAAQRVLEEAGVRESSESPTAS